MSKDSWVTLDELNDWWENEYENHDLVELMNREKDSGISWHFGATR